MRADPTIPEPMTPCLPRLAAAIALAVAAQPASCAETPATIIRDASGCGVVNPNPKPDESITWTGGCKDGLAEGSGLLQWHQGETPGSSYSGRLSAGRPDGQGIETYASGNRYEGNFVDGRRSGHGVFTWTGGLRYDGDFQHGDMTGRGTLTVMDSRVEGPFVHGLLAGPATVVRRSGGVESRLAVDIGPDPSPPAAASGAASGKLPPMADKVSCRPQYPPVAFHMLAQGMTGLALLVDADGKVTRARLIHPAGNDFAHGLLDLSALLGLAGCQALAPRGDGEAAERWIRVSYHWRIE
jgi:hypothetical protein